MSAEKASKKSRQHDTSKLGTSKALAPLRVVELFAGVGGFHVGLCGAGTNSSNKFKVVWANQWEPSTRAQHAAEVYKTRFHKGDEPNNYFNTDINEVVKKDLLPVPEHDLLVGGFPCQDYSVARTLSQATGIDGKKGVLWWAIHKILSRLGKNAPDYLMLENVDRLLKSPAKRRGRDFGIILASLADLGYVVEWRVINAADYGMPQRRKRVFILGYKKSSTIGRKAKTAQPAEWLMKTGVIADAFPVVETTSSELREVELKDSLADLTETFKYPFENAGIMVDRKIFTLRTAPNFQGEPTTLGDILLPSKEVPKEFFIDIKNDGTVEISKGCEKR